MESLRLYRIADKYIWYLKCRDSKVQDNKNKKRPYVGVVLRVGSYQYFVPMESPKPNHANIKPGKHIMRIDKGRLGILGFNNMIPVHIAAVEPFDIDAEPDKQYAELLKRQISFINRHKADVYDHANGTYFDVTNGKNKFLISISCDFRKLEAACNRFDPFFKPKGKTVNNNNT